MGFSESSEGGIDDDVLLVGADRVVEDAAAGDDGGAAVGAVNVDLGAAYQIAQEEEDRYAIGITVADQDRWAELAGERTVLVPADEVAVRDQGRDLDVTVAQQAHRLDRGAHGNGGDADPGR